MSDDPYPLRPGFDYHMATVERHAAARAKRQESYLVAGERHTAERGKREVAYWVASCEACGWKGPARSTKDGAEEDAYAHDITHNEGITYNEG